MLNNPGARVLIGLFGGWLLAVLGAGTTMAGPTIILQPTNLSLSIGATATFRVSARTTTGPIRYQWRLEELPLTNQTNTLLTLTNIQLSHSGAYSVTVTDANASTNSHAGILDVDPTFTKVTSGDIVTSSGSSFGCAFVDYDGDGYVDLYVGNAGVPRNCLYHNNGDGTFSELRSGVWANNFESAAGGVWADYDNDGLLDLAVPTSNGQINSLYRNLGNSSFMRMPSSKVGLTDGGEFIAGAWGDLNADGYADLVLVEFDGTCVLYLNNRDGGFKKVLGSGLPTSTAYYHSCSWCDYDLDGRLDLFLGVYGGIGLLYHNLGDGTFVRVLEHPPCSTPADIVGGSWGDFDNDGYPDLFVANGGLVAPEKSFLYRNGGSAGFIEVTNGSPAALGYGVSGSWADYDNDGFLDLFVCNALGQDNCLYHNNGDGTFTQITRGSPVHDGAHSLNGIWADINNDGFLDLYVSNGGVMGQQQNFLYLNNGNRNAWLLVKLVGTVSNRAAIGAKVRLLANIRGQPVWQMREVSGGGGWCAQNDLRVHFGLGDATNVDLLRIEWPSGTVQELRQLPARQILSVTEPPRLEAKSASRFQVHCWKGMAYEVQSAPDLIHWTRLATVTNLSGTLEVTDPDGPTAAANFYRVRPLTP